MPEHSIPLVDEQEKELLKLLLTLAETTQDRTVKGIALSLFRKLTEKRYS